MPAADSAVVARLKEAGAVLLAKLSLGALALNDIWFGGQTMNPWLLEEGSSGSSAGPGAATAAGQAMRSPGIRHSLAFRDGDLVVDATAHLNAHAGLAYLRIAVRLEPKFPSGKLMLGLALYQAGRIPESLAVCADAVALVRRLRGARLGGEGERLGAARLEGGLGALQPQLTALIRTNVNVQELTVEAALTGKREHVYHAAMLDPHTAAELDLDQIHALVDALLDEHGAWVPTLT